MGSFRMYRSEAATLRRLLARGERIGLFRDPPATGTVASGTSFRLGGRDIAPIAGHLDVVAQEIGAAAANLAERELKNNPRNRDYPYSSPTVGTRNRYRSSFDIEPIYGTRPGVRVANTAKTAAFVEFGNKEAGDWIEADPGKWMTLPLKKRVGKELWARGEPGRNPRIRRVRKAFRGRNSRGQLISITAIILKRGDNFYSLRRKVRTFGGYGILTRATIEGVRNAKILLGIK